MTPKTEFLPAAANALVAKPMSWVVAAILIAASAVISPVALVDAPILFTLFY